MSDVVEWFSALKNGWVRLGVAEENRVLKNAFGNRHQCAIAKLTVQLGPCPREVDRHPKTTDSLHGSLGRATRLPHGA
jgi:hypothetical protein